MNRDAACGAWTFATAVLVVATVFRFGIWEGTLALALCTALGIVGAAVLPGRVLAPRDGGVEGESSGKWAILKGDRGKP